MALAQSGDAVHTRSNTSVDLLATSDGGYLVLNQALGLQRYDSAGKLVFSTTDIGDGNLAFGRVVELSDHRYLIYANGYGVEVGYFHVNARASILSHEGVLQTSFADLGDGREVYGAGVIDQAPGGGFYAAWSDRTNSDTSFGITFAPAGEYHITSGSIGEAYDVSYRLYDGSAVGQEGFVQGYAATQTINGTTTTRLAADQLVLTAATLTGGDFVTVYRDFLAAGNTDGGYHIESSLSLQVRHSDGRLETPLRVNTDAFHTGGVYQDLNPGYPAGSVVALADGGFAVLWTESYRVNDSAGSHDFADTQLRYFNADGTARSDEINVLHRTFAGNLATAVGAMADGSLVIGYDVSVRGANGTGSAEAWLAVINPSGQTTSSYRISPEAHSGQSYGLQDLAVLANGELEVAYNSSLLTDYKVQHFSLSSGATDGNDVLYAASAGELLQGLGGSDTLIGGPSGDVLAGGAGDDVLSGGGGSDYLGGGDGDDRLAAGSGINTVDGGAGVDLGDYSALSGPQWIDLAEGHYSTPDTYDALSSIEGLIGGSGDDHLFGTAGGNLLNGGAGNDVLVGREGDDRLAGGTGSNDLNGGDGLDLADYSATSTGVYVDLASGHYSSPDTWDQFTGIEGLVGGSGADTLLGGAQGDVLLGGEGADILIGRDGDDFLFGGLGADYLVGGSGADNLSGGAGGDIFDLVSGAQLDPVANWDVAADFNPGEDHILLGGMSFRYAQLTDFNGDGIGDTQLAYDGGTFIVLGVSTLSLNDWNALLV